MWSTACTRRKQRREQRRERRRHGMAIESAGGGMMKLGLGLVGILMVAATGPAGAGERMIMKVTPAVAFAPANLIVRATVEADADNRGITVIAESEDFYRSSEIQLDGDRAPRTSRSEEHTSELQSLRHLV